MRFLALHIAISSVLWYGLYLIFSPLFRTIHTSLVVAFGG